jgi:hypothetical protein
MPEKISVGELGSFARAISNGHIGYDGAKSIESRTAQVDCPPLRLVFKATFEPKVETLHSPGTRGSNTQKLDIFCAASIS